MQVHIFKMGDQNVCRTQPSGCTPPSPQIPPRYRTSAGWRIGGGMNCAAKNGMEEFRPEIERVAGGTNWAGKNGMEEFRPELEGVAGGINLAGKNGMEEFRPELQIY